MPLKPRQLPQLVVAHIQFHALKGMYLQQESTGSPRVWMLQQHLSGLLAVGRWDAEDGVEFEKLLV